MKHLSTMKHLRIVASVIGVPILLALAAVADSPFTAGTSPQSVTTTGTWQ